MSLRTLRAAAHSSALAAMLVSASVALVSASGPATTNFGSSYEHGCHADSSSQCKANDRNHGVYVNVTGSYGVQVRWAMANYTSVAPPINMFEVYPPALDKDVEVLAVNRNDVDALAWTACMGAPGASGMQYGGLETSHTRWCRPQRFYYNVYYEAGYFPEDNPKRYIACHELGHTIGLRHRRSGEPSATCMVPATINPKYVPIYITTSGHDRGAIAAGGY